MLGRWRRLRLAGASAAVALLPPRQGARVGWQCRPPWPGSPSAVQDLNHQLVMRPPQEPGRLLRPRAQPKAWTHAQLPHCSR